MNTRVLELIKNPELFQNQDLDLLQSEIKKHPYIQIFRALHLFGTHNFNKENYQTELSETAAYTTDKKILYQFINKNLSENTKPNLQPNIISETQKPESNVKNNDEETVKPVFNEIEIPSVSAPKPVFVNGELNRILFEGEEDFLERKPEIIDIESTIESGQITIHNSDSEKVNDLIKGEVYEAEIPVTDLEVKEVEAENTEFHQAENITQETIINENKISKEETIIETSSELSFHGTEEFLPEVKIKANEVKPEDYEVPKPVLSKHEQEMQRLIAEVEAKMKTSKKEKPKTEEEAHQNEDLNFSETQDFEIPESEKIEVSEKETEEKTISEEIQKPEEIEEKLPVLIQKKQKTDEILPKIIETKKPEWKPMGFVSNTPDSLIDKKEEKSNKKEQIQAENPVPEIERKETESEERPVFNVSFFTEEVSAIETEIKEKIEVGKNQEEEKTTENSENSNVPNFINTWQNWLKIERNEPKIIEKPSISKIEVKSQIIENFIENEPKISKLKEDSDFVIKEKSDDISHLMTETLAKLYVEQKLYSKAIKAHEILIKKYPEKEKLFKDKIKEIKDLRKNP